MKQMVMLRDQLRPLLDPLSPEERKRIDSALDRVDNGISLLESKYRRTIRDRAAVHTLLKKTSGDLIQRYQTIFEYSGTAMLVIESDGIVSLINSYFEKVFGYSRQEVEYKKKFTEFLDEGYKEMLWDYHTRRRESNTPIPHHYEARAIDKEGKILEVNISVGQFPGTGQTIASVMDISDRKRAEEAIRRANEKINILNSLTRHDIINQLTPLFMHLELSMMDTDDPELHKSLQAIEHIGQNIKQHIEFMRLYQEIGVKSPTWQNVADVIRAGTASLFLQGIPLTIDFDAIEIYADPLLQKVFYNLVENALRHAGTFSYIRFYYRENNDGISIFCEDDGIGIPDQEKERIFKREFYKNTGLGLFLSREILSITDITITECGEFGKGARLGILVPERGYQIRSSPE